MDIQLLKCLVECQSVFLSALNQIDNCIMNYGCVDGEIIGTGRADYTQGATFYDLHIEDKCFTLIDIPGIEGDESRYEAIISDSLDKAHAIFYVNGSGKTIESETAKKIKKYMHDGTTVYAIFNVHCKAKKERSPGIDSTFSEELQAAYKKEQDIVNQTERKLKPFLSENYKKSITLNGLLAFSALALAEDDGTTIVQAENKSLRNDQIKYLREYGGCVDQMRDDSQVLQLCDVIEGKMRTYESDIYRENNKKLRNRINEMIQTIENLSDVEEDKIQGFIRAHESLKNQCSSARDDFIYAVSHVASNVVESALSDVRDDLYSMIEREEGKINNSDIEHYFDSHKTTIVDKIQGEVNTRLSLALEDYENAIKDAINRLAKDLEREQLKFQVSLSSSNLALNDALGNSLKYNLKDFGSHLLTTGSLALSGIAVGSMICPGLGTVIGGIAGAVLGVLGAIWNFFTSKQKRIEKAKRRIREAIDDIMDDVTAELDEEIQRLNYTDIIESNYQEWIEQADEQIRSLKTVSKLLCTVLRELKKNEADIKERNLYV